MNTLGYNLLSSFLINNQIFQVRGVQTMKLFSRSPQTSASTASDLRKVNKWTEYCDSELIPPDLSDRSIRKGQSILALIENLWQNAIAALTEAPELKIWQKRDRDGHIHWHAYDPCTDKSVCFASELEMIIWIEKLRSR